MFESGVTDYVSVCVCFYSKTCSKPGVTVSDLLTLYSDWNSVCDLHKDIGVIMLLAKITSCSPWVFWIACNAALHALWVGALLVSQLYQVSDTPSSRVLLLPVGCMCPYIKIHSFVIICRLCVPLHLVAGIRCFL